MLVENTNLENRTTKEVRIDIKANTPGLNNTPETLVNEPFKLRIIAFHSLSHPYKLDENMTASYVQRILKSILTLRTAASCPCFFSCSGGSTPAITKTKKQLAGKISVKSNVLRIRRSVTIEQCQVLLRYGALSYAFQ